MLPLWLGASHAGAATPALKFSHQFHLKTVAAKCTDCHRAAPASVAATDLLLPKEKDCLVCHNGERARKECAVCHPDSKAAKAFEPIHRTFRFPHQNHLALGDIGPLILAAIEKKVYYSQPPPPAADLKTGNECMACHRGVNRVDFADTRNMPQMADCISCHDEIDAPFSCEFCHTKDARLKPANHTPEFLESHSRKNAKLDKQSCTICHGTNFRCLGCH